LFEKILIANRGEIAVRILSTCRKMGVRTVAVHSHADRGALHARLADEAVDVGPAPASESYLNGERLIEVALVTGAQAVHPGYGFLAENATFARSVCEAGLVWIGPPAEAIAQMGDKLSARTLAEAAGVPLVPGSRVLESAKEVSSTAQQLGYPVLLKASAGGGGKGMRAVRTPDDIEAAFERARSEAQRSFGCTDLYLEKLVPQAKHVEMQVFSDGHGAHLWLGERECSIQRRHQKLVEESPSVVLSEAQRRQMGSDAVSLAQRCGYRGAGTVEFLYDVQAKNYYFLEMNTRLQVEHPVTEMVTGLDLVAWQLRVAAGEALPLRQDQIQRRGVAVECRIYAEDPLDFLPSTGHLRAFVPPEGPGVRLDSGVEQGDGVGPYYDPLLAKLVAHGHDRAQAIERLKDALDRFAIAGVTTNVAYHRALLDEPDFQAGKHLTDFVETHNLAVGLDALGENEAQTLAGALYALHEQRERRLRQALKATPDGWPQGER